MKWTCPKKSELWLLSFSNVWSFFHHGLTDDGHRRKSLLYEGPWIFSNREAHMVAHRRPGFERSQPAFGTSGAQCQQHDDPSSGSQLGNGRLKWNGQSLEVDNRHRNIWGKLSTFSCSWNHHLVIEIIQQRSGPTSKRILSANSLSLSQTVLFIHNNVVSVLASNAPNIKKKNLEMYKHKNLYKWF